MTKLATFVALLPLTFPAACIDSEEVSMTDQEIINGSTVDAEDSGMPLLADRCSSVLLSNTWLLTAAHCVDSAVDHRYSADGQSTALFPEGEGVVRAVATDTSGQPIIGGIVSSRFALAKFRTNGAPDPYFNNGQPKLIDFASSTSEELSDIAIDSSGRIVAVGTAIANGRTQIAIARYLSNGQLDTSFDGDGKVLTDIGGLDFLRGHAVAIDDGNRIVVGARIGFDNDTRFAVLRYRTDGALDGTWSHDGMVTTDISLDSHDYLEDIAIDSSGRVLAAGTSNGKLGLARYTTYGNPDTSFSGDGKVWHSYGTSTTSIYGLAVDASGRAIVVGKSAGLWGLLVGRFTAGGAVDTTFADRGWMTYLPRFGIAEATANAVVVDAAGRIIVTGNALHWNGTSAAIVARFRSNGVPDLAFGNDGSVDAYARDDQGMAAEAWARDVALDRNGNIFVAHTGAFETSSGRPYRMGTMHFIADHLAVPAWPALTVKMGSQQVGSAFAYTHPSLDIALVKLATPMKINGSTTGYEFHGFDTSTPSTFVGTTMQCYGYGNNTYDDGFGTLRSAALDVESATFYEYRLVSNEHGQITYRGDSGGPCYSTTGGQWRVSGITSWSTSSPTAKTVVDTNNVAAVRFASWVQSTRTAN